MRCGSLAGLRSASCRRRQPHPAGSDAEVARGFTLRETGLFDAEYVATDLVLAALGVAVYAFWETNPRLVPFALSTVLIHRSPSVRHCRRRPASTEAGLFNARHFAAALWRRSAAPAASSARCR
jgi:hypothetical protein